MNTTPHPTQLQLVNPETLRICWSDNAQFDFTVRQLRELCPCATCREIRGAKPTTPDLLPVLKFEETLPLRIVNMRPVGNYAYAIHFSDGHDTGIYTLTFLRQLGEETASPR
ncbi:MAG: DUF971 domain-containing protein [Planctomycetales bacterium]|nr:DUF971 domain-containing protein [Planctomycetales bacterium]MCA9167253.1 DUF971 domain-containing protein [Planctomycetales bacterium]